MDDNFKSIVSSVKWGRNVYEGVRKFLQFQLTVNVAALILVFIGALTREGAPLRAVQLLWINLIMDVMAALSLATEPPTDALLDQKPHGKTERIVNNRMWKHIMGQGVYQLILTLSLLYAGHLIPWTGGALPQRSRQLYTIIFNSFVWAQLFNEFNCRTLVDDLNCFRNYLHSVYHPIIFCISAGLQAIIVELGGDAFKTAPLSWDQWLFCICMGSGSLLAGFILRSIPNQHSDVLEPPARDAPSLFRNRLFCIWTRFRVEVVRTQQKRFKRQNIKKKDFHSLNEVYSFPSIGTKACPRR
jgi:magnesium-transporting ATPase (P-type)